MEERRTAELMSDFDDYEIADANEVDAEPQAHPDKDSRKKKKSR
jgi:hypothetical protein